MLPAAADVGVPEHCELRDGASPSALERCAIRSTGCSGLIKSGAVPDPDVLHACKARQAGRMIYVNGDARPGAADGIYRTCRIEGVVGTHAYALNDILTLSLIRGS